MARRVAGAYFLFAAAWITLSDLALSALTRDLPDFVGGSLVKGGAFVAITTALLYLFILQNLRRAPDSTPVAGETGEGVSRKLAPALLFGVMALLAIAFVIVMFSYESAQFRESARQQLRAILELKVDQVELLLEQRQATARSYTRSRGLRQDMAELAVRSAPGILSAISERIEFLRRDLEFDAVLVLDAAGKRVATAGAPDLHRVSPALAWQAARSMATGTSVSHFLHRDEAASGAFIALDYVTPLSGDSAGIGALVLRENARGRLFRLIQNWPTASASAETLLVRQDGNDVLYLSDVRHEKDAAFRLRHSLSQVDVIAVKAVGTPGPLLTDGADYRGVAVVAASRPIAGTDWFMIAKIDRDEVLAPLRKSAAIWLGSILCMALLGTAGVAFLWRQQLGLVAANERAEAAGRRLAEEKLGESEERYRALFERSLDCVFLCDFAGNFLDANRAALDLLGYRREEIPSINFRDLLASEDLPRAFSGLQDIILTGNQPAVHEYRLRHRDGREIVVEVRNTLVYNGGKPSAVLGAARDVTARKQAEARIARLTQIRDALSAVNRAIVHADSEDALFSAICEIAVRHGGFLLAWIGVPSPDSGAMLPLTSSGTAAGLRYLERTQVSHHDVPEGRGPTGAALREGRLVIANDFIQDERAAPWREAARDAGIRASAALPLRSGGEIMAALNVYAGSVGYFDAEITALLEEMAGDVSFALDVLAGQRERERARRELAFNNAVLTTQQETSPDAILVVDENGRIVFHNRRFIELWRIPEELVRAGVDEPVLQSVVSRMRNPVDFLNKIKHLYENKGEKGYDELETKDGQLIERHSAPLTGARGEYYGRVWYFRDITERRRAEAALRESEARFRTIVEQSISGFYLIQDGKFCYVNARFAGIFGYASPEEIVGKSPSELVAPQDRETVAGNIRRRLAGEVKSLSYTFTGLRKNGTEFDVGVHGSLATFNGQPAIIGLLQDISERKHAEEEIKRYVARLEQAMQSTINVVATIGELRDPYTHGHERRVGEIAAAIAAEMGIEENQVEGIRIAGYLHDVGKIGVPAEILSKPARLTRAEYDLVKDHAQQSYEILKTVPFPWPVAEAAWQHHERLDGSGYPRGLRADEIILEARVLAVADVVEAMSSHRPYRPGQGVEKAIEEIEQNRGKLFDPAVVDACLRLFREKGYRLPE